MFMHELYFNSNFRVTNIRKKYLEINIKLKKQVRIPTGKRQTIIDNVHLVIGLLPVLQGDILKRIFPFFIYFKTVAPPE